MNPLVFALRRPVTSLILVAGIVSGGVFALKKQGIDVLPAGKLDEYALAKSTLHHKIKRHDVILEAIEDAPALNVRQENIERHRMQRLFAAQAEGGDAIVMVTVTILGERFGGQPAA